MISHNTKKFQTNWNKLDNLKKYGKEPFRVALIHGGPGAAGEMALVANELSSICGVLEPFQTKKTIDEQVQELKSQLEKEADLPVTLVGFSWGAWLSFIFAATYPMLVKKLILIGSGPFEEKYVKNLMATRLNRLSETEKQEIETLNKILSDPATKDKNSLFLRLGCLCSKADSFDPLPFDPKTIIARYDIFEAVWKQGRDLRASGKLLELGKKIQCPCLALHGEYDSHDPQGIKEPLPQVLKQFRFILLKECGHCPWLERKAKEQFYKILKQEI